MRRFNQIRNLVWYHRMPVVYSTYSTRIYTTTSISEETQPSLLAKLKNEVKDAMRKKDQLKLNVVRGLLSDVTYASKSSQKIEADAIPTDQEVYAIINRAIKRRQESIAQFSHGGRKDLVENEQNELNILTSYLPEQMSEKEIEIEVKKTVKKLGIVGEENSKDLGKVMKEIKIDGSKAPKGIVAKIAKKVLSDMNKKE